MQTIKLFEEYQEDPRYKDPLSYIKGIIGEYQNVLTDENPIKLYNISYQTHLGDLIHLRWDRRWRQILIDYLSTEDKKQFDKDIKSLNYRIKVHIVFKIQLVETGRTFYSMDRGGKTRQISLPNPPKIEKLIDLPCYQEFMDRISSDIEEFFIIEDENANKYCQTSDEDGNLLDNIMIYFYPKGCKSLNSRM